MKSWSAGSLSVISLRTSCLSTSLLSNNHLSKLDCCSASYWTFNVFLGPCRCFAVDLTIWCKSWSCGLVFKSISLSDNLSGGSGMQGVTLYNYNYILVVVWICYSPALGHVATLVEWLWQKRPVDNTRIKNVYEILISCKHQPTDFFLLS